MKKFEKSDVFFNIIKSHPQGKFFTYNGNMYINNTIQQSVQLSNFLPPLPPPPLPTVTEENLVLSLDPLDPLSYPGTGTNWFDLTDNNADMILENSPTYDSEGFFQFDGINEASNGFSVSGVNDFSILNDYTVEAWLYSNSSQTGVRSIIEKQYNIGIPPIRYPYSLVHNKTTNQFIFAASDGTTTIQSSTTSVSDQWVQCVGVYDWSNDQLKFYKNGTLVNTTDISSITGTINNAINLTIARRGDFSQWWAGRFAILRIYDKALSPSEVNANFEATKDRFAL